MATFPTLTPSSRTFTPGRHPHSEIPTLDGLQVRVRTSNVILDQQLRLTFLGLTEAQMLSIRSHYIGQQGRFLSFAIPSSLLSGVTTPSYFTPTGYSWIYGSAPQVEDIPCAQRYNVSVELVTVPPEGANINGAEFTIGVTLATVTPLAQTITISFAAGAGTGIVADPNFASVSLLLHMNGSNGSTTFTDTSTTAHSISVFGNAQVTTTSPKFGTGALLLDGAGDYLSAPSHTSLTLGTGDFTIEAWVRFDTVSAAQYIFSQRDTGGFSLLLLADGRLQGITPSLNTVTEVSATMAVDTWYHVAFTRSGTSYNIWVGGISSATGTITGEDGASGISYIGYRGSGGVTYLDGRIDDLRITKGVARYTTTFTPPTAAFPDA
jgi:hypothetical protein